MNKNNIKQNSMNEIIKLLSAKVPIIWVLTHEEDRFLEDLYSNLNKKELWAWSAWSGIYKFDPETLPIRASGEWDKTWEASIALNKISEYPVSNNIFGCIFVMKDFHTVLHGAIPRTLRDMYAKLSTENKVIIIVSSYLQHGKSMGIEPTLDKQITVVNYELPDYDYIHDFILKVLNKFEEVKSNKQFEKKYSEEEIDSFAKALQGLTSMEIENSVYSCFAKLSKLDAKQLLNQKKQIVKRSEILEYIDQSPSMNEVGGLDEAKKYFQMYKDQFSPEAKDFGIEPLRGVLLTGIAGTGKSLLAKTIASEWNLPLLRLDIGRVMSSLVGSSEAKMREVVLQLEALAPCICWIDEIEKGLSGMKSSNHSDGGTIARVFGTLLTAMEEKFKGVVVLATANDISALPPELIRRFNEILFVDLPEPLERQEIFEIHLMKRKRNSSKLKLNTKQLVAATHKFTGSEIEKVVKEGIIRAWHDNKSELSTKHLINAIKDMKPIAIMMGEKIEQIREWARNRARYASSLAARANASCAQKVTTKSGKELDLNSDLSELDEVILPNKKIKSKNKKRMRDIGNE